MSNYKVILTFLYLLVLVTVIASCGESIPTPAQIPSPTFETTPGTRAPKPTWTRLPTYTYTPRPSSTATSISAVRTAQKIWQNTALAIQSTQAAMDQLTRIAQQTQIAQFPPACMDNGLGGQVSPNGLWLATSCGYKSNQTMIVQNKQGMRWILDLRDFVIPSFIENGSVIGPGLVVNALFWSPDGAYLYFSTDIGYSGGGDQCFEGFGSYGLFRLNLKKDHG